MADPFGGDLQGYVQDGQYMEELMDAGVPTDPAGAFR